MTRDVVIIGAGIIGAAIAWRCAQRGLTVELVDPDPARGAWHTAAGMLAPITELTYTETALLRLSLDSLQHYPSFAAELADAAGLPTGLSAGGTVSVAWDSADLAGLRDQHAFALTLGLESALLTGREVRELEPALAPGLPGGRLATGEHRVDPRLLHAALLAAGTRLGVHLHRQSGAPAVTGARCRGVRLEDGRELAAGQVVIAAGAWSGDIAGLPSRIPVRPVKGQTVRLRLPGAPRLRHVVRAEIKGNPSYLVPRDDGRIVIGASSEDAGFDRRPRAGAVYELLRDAQSLLPELGEAEFEEVSTGLRPGTPDNAPLVGGAGVEGLTLATGHYRNGVLLAPVTADGVAELLTRGVLPDVLTPFTPDRFVAAPA
jgi:glycine oxidase